MKKPAVIIKLKFIFGLLRQPRKIFAIIGFALTAGYIFFISYSLGINPVIILFLFSLAIYLKFLQKNLFLKGCRIINLILLLVIIFLLGYFITRIGWPVYWTPIAAITMLATLLFSQPVISLLIAVGSAVTVAFIERGDLYLGTLFLISGILSSVLVFGARRRGVIIRSGFIIGIVQALSLFFIKRFDPSGLNDYAILVANGVLCAIATLGTLTIFEYLFNTVTNVSLLELADFNHPLLNRMILEAPGTYHHSLIVGNLSEAACSAIGANSLLARVGAYYHDLGKLRKPEYFSENQALKGNKHEALSPTMSKLVIINHVKEGMDLAREYNINPRLVDFIQQHHGTSLVYYFYKRAIEALEEDQDVKEDGFRYTGPKPNTKETAVVLLADSVEAATRALKEPSAQKIEEVVHKIINNKFIDGQLDECDLTLKDLEKISGVFIHILSGIYHTRVSYPDEKTGNSNKKFTK
ncbi:MAG: HDIG domain-containing metalloprotein [Candidatus Omnitrophota bacterium]|nr:HDIG domain-containing protein [Candidatus Omnitrophota bacterium]MBU1929086.1 HDIG domain-containing protein [Candidatus Omnitrophota bacterium]MBU1929163.1 HDIG domain-containing protein [Candidatus Omnitrophota bacterium]MBU2035043.1 HDIG domain-containing protein [Candidatus Omnitrophota bacterium]MBU2257793.1 HDIG domain-containing protein [Candidatus Omnitrophota bacterium]